LSPRPFPCRTCHNSFFPQHLPFHIVLGKLGWFGAVGSGLEPWNDGILERWGIPSAGNWVRFAQSPPKARRAARDWVRFAGFAPANWVRLAHSSPRGGAIWPNRVRFTRLASDWNAGIMEYWNGGGYPAHRELGSFRIFRLQDLAPATPGRIGFASYSWLQPIGFVSRSGASRRCRAVGSSQLGLFVQPARIGPRRQAGPQASHRNSVFNPQSEIRNPQFTWRASQRLFLPHPNQKS
jgi:hypothetical protein